MATFTQFLDILPDPNIKIGAAGQQDDASGTAGQGFSSIKLSRPSGGKIIRTIGGKVISNNQGASKWLVDLTYYPMTREQFDPVYNFLLQKQTELRPFYVILPTYKIPKDPIFATYVASTDVLTTEAGTAGELSLEIEDTQDSSGNGLPMFGDLFHFEDTNDTLHTKAYMISGVETTTDYLAGNQPTAGSIRIHFTPQLQRKTTSGSKVIFDSPKIRVRQIGDVREYTLNKDKEYVFSLRLEEVTF